MILKSSLIARPLPVACHGKSFLKVTDLKPEHHFFAAPTKKGLHWPVVGSTDATSVKNYRFRRAFFRVKLTRNVDPKLPISPSSRATKGIPLFRFDAFN